MTQSVDALTHILDNVFGRGKETPIGKALALHGIIEILDLVNLRQEDIDSLTYPDSEDKCILRNLNPGDKNIIRIFIKYTTYQTYNGDAIGDNWTSITRSLFADYRNNNKVTTPTHPPIIQDSPKITTPMIMPTPADKFRHSTKRDPTQFPIIKDENMKDIWHRKMNIQARVQGVSHVLDQNYTPTTLEEVELFDEMQKFMYAILDKNVLTDQGRAIVRAHEATYNAQKAYNEIKNHHNSSTKAKIEASSILSYITSVKIDDGSWQGTAEGFILNWQEQLAKYENLTDTAETFSDIQKYNMLQNAVMPIADLYNVKVNVDIWYIITGNILSYQQYVGLLLSAASLHDTKFGAEQHQYMDMYTIKGDRDNKASDISSIDNTHHITQPIPWVEAKTHILYQVSQARSCFKASLIDRGANGGVAGSDVQIIHQTPPNACRVDIQGIDDHQLTNIPIGTVGGVVTTQHGPVIAIMHQYALHGKGQTIHSPGQFEWYKIIIDDKLIHVGGLQRIKTLDGYIIPLTIKNGLACLEIRPYTDHEWDTLPRVILTSEDNWDPSVLDFEHDEDDWYDAVKELEGNPHTNLFDEFGNYRHRMLEDNTQQVIDHDMQDIMEVNEYEHEPEDDVKTYSQPHPP